MPDFESHNEILREFVMEYLDTFPVCENEKNSYDIRFNNDFAKMNYE